MLHGIHMNLVKLVYFVLTVEDEDFDMRCKRLEGLVQWHYGNGLGKDKTRFWEILCMVIAIIQIEEN